LVHNSNPKTAGQEADTAATLGEIQIAQKHGVGIYPNPTQDKIILAIDNLNPDEAALVIITDEIGKTLYTQNNLKTENKIDMSSYNIGTYFVKVMVGTDITVYKVLRIQ
jgi:hypothetical protein